MQITANQLNQIAALIGTTDRQVVISAAIKFLTDAGMALDAAFDAVFGEGAYVRMAGDLQAAMTAA
jgi:uncharacterized membrane protein YdfJ with MMPL/SSD domain